MRYIVALVLLLLVTPAFASHSETDETGWFEYQYDADDEAVLYCNGLGAIALGDSLYIHDRPGPNHLYGTGPIGEGGGGTWIATESNGIAGYQVGGSFFFQPQPPGGHIDYHSDPLRDSCPNGDAFIF